MGSESSGFDLIHFDLESILLFSKIQASYNEVRSTKRRRSDKNNTDLIIEDLHYTDLNEKIKRKEEDTTYDEFKWLTISDKSFEFTDTSPVDLETYKDKMLNLTELSNDSWQFYTEDIRVTIDPTDSLLKVKTKPSSSNKSQLLLSINLVRWDEEEKRVLKNELSLINLPASKRNFNTLITSPPSILIKFLPSSNKVSLSLSFSIQVRSGVFNYYTSDLVKMITSIILHNTVEYPPTSYSYDKAFDVFEPISPRLFYNVISHRTLSLNKVDKDFEILELETNLMKFQKKSVNWLLFKEGVKYNYEWNKCVKDPLINSNVYYALLDSIQKGEYTDSLDAEVIDILNRLVFGWQRYLKEEEVYFYNKYSGNLIDRKGIYEYLSFYHTQGNSHTFPQQLPAQGLLAEEMGLGKTVEITSLILMNQRPLNEVNEPISLRLSPYGDVKTITKARTTLVIAPDSILKQWVDEVVSLAPSLAVTVYSGNGKYPKFHNNAQLVSEYLRSFDIVFTTYSTISKELDYALYSSKNKPTRTATKRNYKDSDDEGEIRDSQWSQEEKFQNLLKEYRYLFQLSLTAEKAKVAEKGLDKEEINYEKAIMDEVYLAEKHNEMPSIYRTNDYQSPLMLTQFWRIVMDEVQMVSSKLSRAFQTAALIPRYHAWGVSGTPIKKDLGDLKSILKFLKVSPFDSEKAKYPWNTLVGSPDGKNEDFIRLWTMLGIRHTKDMVHDDIRLPPQSRVLMTIPFSAVEQENYNQALEECLMAIALDVNGNPIAQDWEPTPTVLSFMRSWLVRLRQICCNPQIGRLSVSSKKYRTRNRAYLGKNVNVIQQLKTLENVLEDMIDQVVNQIVDSERSLMQLYVELGQFEEFRYEPKSALEFLETGVTQSKRICTRLNASLNWYYYEYRKYKLDQGKTGNYELNNDGNIDSDDEITKADDEDEISRSHKERITSTKLRIRTWNVLLHKFYFLIASGYFQLYDPEYQSKIQEFRREGVPLTNELEEFKKKRTRYRSDDISELFGITSQNEEENNDKKSFEGFQPDPNVSHKENEVNKYKYFESKYYDLAEGSRQKILKSSIRNVEKAVKSRITSRLSGEAKESKDDGSVTFPKSSRKFVMTLPIIILEDIKEMGVTMKGRLLYDKLIRISDELNSQAHNINSWVSELVAILRKPLLTHDNNPDGEEYEETIHDQDKASCYLYILGLALSDRNECINGHDTSVKASMSKFQQQQDIEAELQRINDAEFLNLLQEQRKKIKPVSKMSLNDITMGIKDIEVELKGENYSDGSTDPRTALIISVGDRLRNIFENQKNTLVLMQKEISQNSNAVFNTRIDYFKQLQQISDTVKQQMYSLNREALDVGGLVNHYSKFTYNCVSMNSFIDKAIAKFRYLKSLVKPESGGAFGDDLMCIICRSEITIGSLTQCGHKYCKDCLDQWLVNSGVCPMCKTHIAVSSVYNFTHHRAELKVTEIEDKKLGDKANSSLYTIYKPVDPCIVEELDRIQLKNSYSSKVDIIVKQVLNLKSKDPNVKIVVFSQWQDLLYILGTAFKSMDISYLGSHGTLTPEVGGGRRRSKYDTVEEFKDPSKGVTCFLLNAKAQASGLTLVNASHIFLCEPLVNTSLELQAISRIHRIGQIKPTTVWMFVIDNTVEESIVIMSTNKRLQYLEQNFQSKKEANKFKGPSTSTINSDERILSKAESMTLMNSGGIDTLVNKGVGEGETVTNSDLWNAFFSSRVKDSKDK